MTTRQCSQGTDSQARGWSPSVSLSHGVRLLRWDSVTQRLTSTADGLASFSGSAPQPASRSNSGLHVMADLQKNIPEPARKQALRLKLSLPLRGDGAVPLRGGGPPEGAQRGNGLCTMRRGLQAERSLG